MQGRSKTINIIIGVITITAVVVFTFVLINSFFSNEITSDDLTDDVATESIFNTEGYDAVDAPAEIEIQKIGVKANVQHVGISKKGNMAVPTNYTEVGWYKLGPKPGQKGTAVIDGHLDNGLGLKAVFGDLSELKVGDEIIVRTGEGNELKFQVKSFAEYEFDDPDAPEAIFKPADVPTLKLITCNGEWYQSSKMYDKRLVVTAELLK